MRSRERVVVTAFVACAVLATAGVLARTGGGVRKERVPPVASIETLGHGSRLEEAVEALARQLEGGRTVIEGLEFIGGSDTLRASSNGVLAYLARAIEMSTGTYLVEAHVASSGDIVSDQSLTDRRAAAVRARLVAAGVPASRLFAMGFGATRPPPARDGAVQSRIEISRMP